MDLISLEMGLVFLLVFMAPVIYILTKERTKKKKLNTAIDKICAENGIHRSKSESIGNQIFILDDAHQKLLSYHKKLGQFNILDLTKYNSCTLQKSKSKNKHYKTIILDISLSFQPKKQEDSCLISIYDDSYENPLEAEAILYEADRFVRTLNPHF